MGNARMRRSMIVLVAVGAVLILGAAVTFAVWQASTPPDALSNQDTLSTLDALATPSTRSTPGASASASLAPTSSAASTPTQPTKPVPPPPPVRGGKPGPGNTGPPAGTKLTVVTGNVTYATANQVINGLDIHGLVQIRAKNVTIKNSIVRGGPNAPCNSALIAVSGSGSATIQDTEVVAANPGPCLDGVWAENTTLLRVNIHGAVDGVKAGDNVTVQDSYIHDLTYFTSDPNQGGGPTHNDAVQSFEGNAHIMLRHNTMSPGAKGNAAVQVTQDGDGKVSDLHIDGNWVDGGGCTLNFAHKKAPMTGIFVTNNRFGRGSVFACPILVSTQTTLSQLSGNVWDDSGRPIPAPQRHD